MAASTFSSTDDAAFPFLLRSKTDRYMLWYTDSLLPSVDPSYAPLRVDPAAPPFPLVFRAAAAAGKCNLSAPSRSSSVTSCSTSSRSEPLLSGSSNQAGVNSVSNNNGRKVKPPSKYVKANVNEDSVPNVPMPVVAACSDIRMEKMRRGGVATQDRPVQNLAQTAVDRLHALLSMLFDSSEDKSEEDGFWQHGASRPKEHKRGRLHPHYVTINAMYFRNR
ncbi:hypothetical protein KC366_g58 [Hortaea werneckii]|nr:hypothetical protein KC366_g58 [Hortaea werneckii]